MYMLHQAPNVRGCRDIFTKHLLLISQQQKPEIDSKIDKNLNEILKERNQFDIHNPTFERTKLMTYVSYILDGGPIANVNATDSTGKTPLIYAVLTNQVDLATLLLQQNADPCLFDSDGFTALHVAAQQDNVTMVKLLLEDKRVHQQDIMFEVTAEGLCPIQLTNSLEVKEILIQAGSPVFRAASSDSEANSNSASPMLFPKFF